MKTITLIGMMGSGKTTLGKLLAKRMDLQSLDIDFLIEQKEKKTISEIFSTMGEPYFRNLEKRIIQNNFVPENLVISTGGGAFETKESREFLINNSTVIYLKTSPDIILQRIKNDTTRPLLSGNVTKEKIQNLINLRQKNYEIAHYIITTDNKKPEEILEEISGVL